MVLLVGKLSRQEVSALDLHDQVKSTADKGAPLERENCSANPPPDGVYFSIMLM